MCQAHLARAGAAGDGRVKTEVFDLTGAPAYKKVKTEPVAVPAAAATTREPARARAVPKAAPPTPVAVERPGRAAGVWTLRDELGDVAEKAKSADSFPQFQDVDNDEDLWQHICEDKWGREGAAKLQPRRDPAARGWLSWQKVYESMLCRECLQPVEKMIWPTPDVCRAGYCIIVCNKCMREVSSMRTDGDRYARGLPRYLERCKADDVYEGYHRKLVHRICFYLTESTTVTKSFVTVTDDDSEHSDDSDICA